MSTAAAAASSVGSARLSSLPATPPLLFFKDNLLTPLRSEDADELLDADLPRSSGAFGCDADDEDELEPERSLDSDFDFLSTGVDDLDLEAEFFLSGDVDCCLRLDFLSSELDPERTPEADGG